MDSFNDELLKEYLLDSGEHVDTIEGIVVNHEKDISQDDINELFRAFHTIKGNSALIGQPVIRDFCHIIESMVGEVRNGARTFTSTMTDIVLESVDILKSMLEELENSATKIETDHSSVSEKIKALMESDEGKTQTTQTELKETPAKKSKEKPAAAKTTPVAVEVMVVKTTAKIAIFEIMETLAGHILDDFIAHLRTFQQRGIENYVFNFEKTKEVKDGGVDVIVTAIREIEMCNGKHFSCGISGNVSSAFHSNGSSEIVVVKPSLKEALTSLGVC